MKKKWLWLILSLLIIELGVVAYFFVRPFEPKTVRPSTDTSSVKLMETSLTTSESQPEEEEPQYPQKKANQKAKPKPKPQPEEQPVESKI